MNVGDKIKIHAYKHDGRIYRAWNNIVVLEINDEYIALGNDRSKVTEENGRVWFTKEPAVIYFYKNRWFNVIGQLKEKGLFYYCNIASPYIVDNNIIKYVDYDLDLRVFPDFSLKILDQNEYDMHNKDFNYGNSIDKIVKYELNKLIEMVKIRQIPFIKNEIIEKHKKYLEIIRKKD